MKKGCFFLLLVWAVAWAAYYNFLRTTELSGQWWVAPLLALGMTLVAANLLGIVQAFQQIKASKKTPSLWKDGELVGVSGHLNVPRPVKAPFSGTAAAFVEYEIAKESSDPENNSTHMEYMGFLMAPMTIQTEREAVRLVGFPLLAPLNKNNVTEPQAYLSAADFIRSTQFKPRASNPIKIIAELNAVLKDDDGDVNAHFCDKHATLHLPEEQSDSEEEVPTGANAPVVATLTEREKLAEQLRGFGYELNEIVVPASAEVTVFGTYRGAQQAIDIGSGLTHLSHSLAMGSIGNITTKNMRKNILAALFWTVVWISGHCYVMKLLHMPFVP